jgi:hypothetical protein
MSQLCKHRSQYGLLITLTYDAYNPPPPLEYANAMMAALPYLKGEDILHMSRDILFIFSSKEKQIQHLFEQTTSDGPLGIHASVFNPKGEVEDES